MMQCGKLRYNLKTRLLIGGTLAATVAVLQAAGVIAIPPSAVWIAFGVAVLFGVAVFLVLQKVSEM
jgi:hypothetical protein